MRRATAVGILISFIPMGGCKEKPEYTKESLDRAAASAEAENHRKGLAFAEEQRAKAEARVAPLTAKQNEEVVPSSPPTEKRGREYFVTAKGMYLLDSPEACKKAASLAATAPARFPEFLSEHGIPIAKDTRVDKLGSKGLLPIHYNVEVSSSGERGWISSEFISER